MTDQIITTAISAVLSGALSSLATVAALNVHITYLREIVKGHDERIRALEAGR